MEGSVEWSVDGARESVNLVKDRPVNILIDNLYND